MQVSQDSKCKNALSLVKTSTSKDKNFEYALGYDEKNSIIQIGRGFNSFFANSDSDNCPVKTCTLKSAGCSFDYNDIYISMAKQFPYQIKSISDKPAGYVSNACFECSNGYQTIRQDDIQVKQTKATSTTIIFVIVIIILVVLFFVVGALYFNKMKQDHMKKEEDTKLEHQQEMHAKCDEVRRQTTKLFKDQHELEMSKLETQA